jgi:hypothetical protein
MSPTWDQVIIAIKEVGFPIVAFLLVLTAIMGMVVPSVNYFIRRLDAIMLRQESTFDRIDDKITFIGNRQAEATERLANSQVEVAKELAKLSEATRGVMVFLSHTQAEVVAHRAAIEGTTAVPTAVVQQHGEAKQNARGQD